MFSKFDRKFTPKQLNELQIEKKKTHKENHTNKHIIKLQKTSEKDILKAAREKKDNLNTKEQRQE